jgi:hypothetical protein
VNGEEFEIRNCFAGFLFCVSSEWRSPKKDLLNKNLPETGETRS